MKSKYLSAARKSLFWVARLLIHCAGRAAVQQRSCRYLFIGCLETSWHKKAARVTVSKDSFPPSVLCILADFRTFSCKIWSKLISRVLSVKVCIVHAVSGGRQAKWGLFYTESWAVGVGTTALRKHINQHRFTLIRLV